MSPSPDYSIFDQPYPNIKNFAPNDAPLEFHFTGDIPGVLRDILRLPASPPAAVSSADVGTGVEMGAA